MKDVTDEFEDFIDEFDVDIKPVNHVVFLIDISGSMGDKKSFIVDSFNEQLKVMKENSDQKTYVTLVFFDHNYKIIYYEKDVKEVEDLNDVEIGGMTSLYDTMGKFILDISQDVKELKDKKKNHSALFIVITDGLDNTSKHYDYDKVKSMIKELENDETWTFTFAGVEFDAIGAYSGLTTTINNNINLQDVGKAAETFSRSLGDYYTLRSSGETKSMNFYNTLDNDNTDESSSKSTEQKFKELVDVFNDLEHKSSYVDYEEKIKSWVSENGYEGTYEFDNMSGKIITKEK